MQGRRGQIDRPELERRVRARFGEMVRQRLDLTDEQAQRLGETVQGFQEDRRRLFREEQALRRRVEALVLEGGDDTAETAEARELLDRMQGLREEEARLSASEQERLLEVLTPLQVLRFQALRDEMGRRIRSLRGGGSGGSDGPGGPGGPPGGGAFLPER
jgi:Spy/CpxP family protein refolding chaperone